MGYRILKAIVQVEVVCNCCGEVTTTVESETDLQARQELTNQGWIVEQIHWKGSSFDQDEFAAVCRSCMETHRTVTAILGGSR